jgi:hypothetical protein
MATPTNLPAAQTTGNVLTAAYVNDLRGAFRVLQVVSATTASALSQTTSTYADTGLTATITPQSNTSQILVLVGQNGLLKQGDSAVNIRLLRGGTSISVVTTEAGYTGTSTNNYATASAFYLDSPATTSATTYKTQYGSKTNGQASHVQFGAATSYIVLLEISA